MKIKLLLFKEGLGLYVFAHIFSTLIDVPKYKNGKP